MNVNNVKYDSLWNKLENYPLVVQASYPKTIGDATHLLTNWKASTAASTHPTPNPNDRDRRNPGGTPAVSFATTDWATFLPLPTNDDFSALAGFDSTRPTFAPLRKPPRNISPDIECIKCKKKGYYAIDCPFIISPQLFQFARPSVQLNQTQAQSILVPGSIIIDSGSTFNCFREHNLISDMHSCNPFTTYSNGGGMTYRKKGTVNVFQELDCYYHPECLVNIISLDLLQTKYHTTFDPEKKNTFTVEVSDIVSKVLEVDFTSLS